MTEEKKSTTHIEIAKQEGLDALTTKRFVWYMLKRWKEKEELHCLTGYSQKWARQFKAGIEFGCSDREGQAVLFLMSLEERRWK